MQDKKPRPVGRPAFKKGKAKSDILKMRVQPSERAMYERAAKAAGSPDLSTWVRDALNYCASKKTEGQS
jgi:uncharacterized protein (DUF1778 family)